MNHKFLEFEVLHVNGTLSFYFEVENSSNKCYSINIKIDEEGNIIHKNCTCVFSSYYKYSKKNMEKNRECSHIKKAINFIKYWGTLNGKFS